MRFHWKWRVGIGGKLPEMSPFEALEIPTTMDHGNSEFENTRFVFSKCELSGITSLDLYTS